MTDWTSAWRDSGIDIPDWEETKAMTHPPITDEMVERAKNAVASMLSVSEDYLDAIVRAALEAALSGKEE